MLTAYSKLVDNLGQAVRTQLVDGLLADLLQDLRFLRVYESPVMKIAGVFFPSKLRSCVLTYILIFQKQIDLEKMEEYAVDFAKEFNAEYWSVSAKSGFVYFE
jgi:hypothetical protein